MTDWADRRAAEQLPCDCLSCKTGAHHELCTVRHRPGVAAALRKVAGECAGVVERIYDGASELHLDGNRRRIARGLATAIRDRFPQQEDSDE